MVNMGRLNNKAIIRMLGFQHFCKNESPPVIARFIENCAQTDRMNRLRAKGVVWHAASALNLSLDQLALKRTRGFGLM